MNKKRLLCIVLSLSAIFSVLLIRDSAAWFNTRSGEPLPQELRIRKLNFDFDGELGSYLQYTNDQSDFIMSDQNLILNNDGKISLTNYSTIKTSVRFCIVYDTPKEEDRMFSNSASDILSATVADGWTFNAETGYFEHEDFDVVESDEGESMDVLTSIYFDSTKVAALTDTFELDGSGNPVLDSNGNKVAFSGNIKVVFQAKQAEKVDWADIGTISTT